ncbi:hypothetical protein [Pantoea agglomerans]|uniref:Uncharacterized protein n=1 Tax=Enterobacter agglomerans TaxID=549 RepID=A0AAN2FFB6_ENTAG|nr:hypothetical protein [Pantoea agglomerans]CAH6333895.1 hypothetical protein DAPPPG734_18345 [Pantoea agglomerans]
MASDWNEELDRYEQGRNLNDDLKDSFQTSLSALGFLVSVLPIKKKSGGIDEVYETLNSEGWREGPQGYGYYRNGVKD